MQKIREEYLLYHERCCNLFKLYTMKELTDADWSVLTKQVRDTANKCADKVKVALLTGELRAIEEFWKQQTEG